jgi:hypothetical protein
LQTIRLWLGFTTEIKKPPIEWATERRITTPRHRSRVGNRKLVNALAEKGEEARGKTPPRPALGDGCGGEAAAAAAKLGATDGP